MHAEMRLKPFLQYSPKSWVVPTCSGVSRYRNSAPGSWKLASVFLYEGLAGWVLNLGIQQTLTSSSFRQRFGAIASLLPKAVGLKLLTSPYLTWVKFSQIPSFNMGNHTKSDLIALL